MERVAMPVFNGRVAPVFDWAGRLLVTEPEGRSEPPGEEMDMSGVSPYHRPALLTRAGAGVLICGGISPALAAQVSAAGIEVIAGIAGEVGEVLAAFRAGRLAGPRWAMPGWCGRPGGAGRGRRGRRNRRCGRRGGRRGGRGWGTGPGGGVR